MRRLPLCSLLLGALALGAVHAFESPRLAPAERVAAAARAFGATLEDEQRGQAFRPFDDEQRGQWHFVPGDRSGLALGEMDTAQRVAAHALLRSVLSDGGYLKTTGVMALEQVLRVLENRDSRDQELYWFSIYGAPSDEAPWAFRCEGHHLSLQFTFVPGQGFSATPMFFGSNPAEVRSGPRAGLKVLAEEEDAARRLLATLSDEQVQQVRIAEQPPADVLLVPDHGPHPGEPQGLSSSDMTNEQFDLLLDLISVYVDRLDPDLAGEHWDRILAVPDEAFEFHFAWAGSFDPEARHYYRVQGPTFALEYDDYQNGANHVHTVWRDFDQDFGAGFLESDG